MKPETDGELEQVFLHGVRFERVSIAPESERQHPVDVYPHRSAPVIEAVEVFFLSVIIRDGEAVSLVEAAEGG